MFEILGRLPDVGDNRIPSKRDCGMLKETAGSGLSLGPPLSITAAVGFGGRSKLKTRKSFRVYLTDSHGKRC